MSNLKHKMVIVLDNLNFRIHPSSTFILFESMREIFDNKFLSKVDEYFTENEMFELRITIGRKSEYNGDKSQNRNFSDYEHDINLSLDDSEPIDFLYDNNSVNQREEPLPF